MTHVMIDLETLDNIPTSVVLSCGMIEFDPYKGAMDEEGDFLGYPSVQDQIDKGRTISEDTLLWWMDQSDAAKDDWVKAKRKPLLEFKEDFRNWFSFKQEIYVWGNGSIFDISILEHLLEYTRIPWKYYRVMDTRTLWKVHPYDKNKKGETTHTALADAKAQAKRIIEVWPKSQSR